MQTLDYMYLSSQSEEIRTLTEKRLKVTHALICGKNVGWLITPTSCGA